MIYLYMFFIVYSCLEVSKYSQSICKLFHISYLQIKR